MPAGCSLTYIMMRKIFISVCIFCSLSVNAQSTQNDWENPKMPFFNTIDPHSFFIPYPSEREAIEAGASPSVLSLNGTWKFNIVKNPEGRPLDFYKNSYDVSQWSDIKVPANWQTEGFDTYIFTDVEYPIPVNPPFVPKDFNPVGSYKRSFELPVNWKGKNVFFTVGAANSFLYVWINGQYVGFHKDSKTPAEFDITNYIKPGKNQVSMQIFRFSDGTYLEGQDMWKLSGIERSVYLVARPKTSVRDFFVKATLDDTYQNGLFDLSVEMSAKTASDYQKSLQVKLIDDISKKILYEKNEKLNSQTFQFNDTLKNIRKWSAETPSLYTLVINLTDEKGKVIESIAHPVGFRSVEVKHGLFLVNGKAIKLKGANRHEHDMYTAKVITPELMKKDIELMKQFNINAVRNSHYPNSVEWYKLCDQYGIYLIDEANIECDGMSFSLLKTLSDKPEWKEAYLARTAAMFQRDKNFTSIITWSLGNESRFGENFIATYDYLKSRDDTRPVQYEEAQKTPYTDIIPPMYKSLNVMLEYVKEWRPKPFIQCEYAHMMGNSGGNLKDDWDLIYKYPQLQGGFIWDFVDQAFKIKDKNGRDIWGYGRDMGIVGVTSDTSFPADGAFATDRTPHPQAFELKKVYQNIHFENVSFSCNSIKITNRYDFTNLNKFIIKWNIKADGEIVSEGVLPEIDLEPGTSAEVIIPFPEIKVQPRTEYFLNLTAVTKEEAPLIPAGYVVATEQFKLPYYDSSSIPSILGFQPLHSERNNKKLAISGDKFSVSFDEKSGLLQGYTIGSNEMIQRPLQPHFWRAATDNDIGNSQQMRCEVWENAFENATLDSLIFDNDNELEFKLKTVHFLPAVRARYITSYSIKANGDVQVNARMLAGDTSLPELPRFGMRVIMNANYDQAKWFGRGPFDNYSDRKYAADVDVYRMPADSLFHPYARAQESGYRIDVRWVGLFDKSGSGLLAISDSLMSTGIVHFDYNRLNFDRNAPENNHGGSMNNDNFIWWNIDYAQSGVGGDNAWGAKPHSEYQLPYRDYSYSFTLRPVYQGEQIIERAK